MELKEMEKNYWKIERKEKNERNLFRRKK